MDCGLFGVRFLFLGIKKEAVQNRSFIYFATAPCYAEKPRILGKK